VYVVNAVAPYAVAATLTVGNSPGTGPNGIAVNATTNKTYVADYGGSTVSVIDGGNNYAVHAVTVGNEPLNIAVNASTNTIYVTNYQDNTVSAINASTVPETVTTIPTGTGPRWLAVNPVTNKVYVANQNGTVTVITGTSTTTTSIPAVGSNLSQIAVNTTTNMVYVGNNTPYSTGIVVINGATNTISSTVPCDPSWGVAVNSATNKIYVTNNFITDNGYGDDTVTVIDGSNNSAGAVAAPGEPKSVAINSVTNRVYVANYEDSAVTVIDGTSSQTWSIAVDPYPTAIGVSVSPNLVFVASAGSGSGSLAVIDPNLSFGTVAPTVSITSPANGSVVSQTVTIQANASAGLALAGVQVELDGANLGAQVTSAPYAMSWNTTQTANGSHSITAVAQDSAGNTATSSGVTVTVANGGTTFSLTPQANGSTSATVTAGGTATYLLNLISGASFSGTVALTCSGAPATTVCSISPASSNISANSTVPVTVTLTTVPQSASVAYPGKRRSPFIFALTLLVPVALAGWRGSQRRKTIRQWVIGGLLALVLLLACCGGGGAVPTTSFSTSKSTGTASGNYTLTITGTSGTLTPVITYLTLTVT
jgi:YVTN family beta-propeller protein